MQLSELKMRKHFLTYLSAFLLQFLNAQQHRITLDPGLRPFYHGVASGDPTDTSVMIWTRVTPDSGNADNIDVYWQISTDTSFNNIVNYGKLKAKQSNDLCVKVDVCGLQPNRSYYYMFNAFGINSLTGRTKTAPAKLADSDSVRFAVVSCADYENGYFNAYESIVNKNNVDAVVHLGDYIYEYETGGISINNPGRFYEPLTEVISMQDYRIRHSHYKLDPQLRRIHQTFPFITVWDDHETCNDAYRDGGQNHQANEGSYAVRKSNSTSTYFTWMPLRKPDPFDTLRIFRKLRYGKLLDLIMLDTRLYDRDEQDIASANDSTHKLMGPLEMAWFLQQLSDTSTRWKIIGNQVMFAPLQIFGQPFNADQWDGYNYERTKIQNHILNTNIKNVVMLTGDIHTSWCNDVPGNNYDPNTGNGSICVEFVGTSVTSLNSPLPVGVGIIQSLNPHMKYIDLDHHGYYILDVRKNRTQADYTYVRTDQLGFNNDEAASYYVNNNERHLRQGAPVINYPSISAPLPSLLPNQNIGFVKITDQYLMVNENSSGTVNIIPSQPVCPSINLQLIDPANHGATISLNGKDVVYAPAQNYYGSDTVIYAVCSSTIPVTCDTVYLYVTVNGILDKDTVVVNLTNDTTYNDCVSFDDLTSGVTQMNNSPVTNGVFTSNGLCFFFTPDSNFCGTQTIIFSSCDVNLTCDTVVYQLRVNVPVTRSSLSVSINKNTNYLYCPGFDDLVCQHQNLNVISNPKNGTYQLLGDSCFRYFPYFNYTGIDSMTIVGCDTCGNSHCDTIDIYFNIQEPNLADEIHDLVVLGVYPNPASENIFIQMYQYKSLPLNMKVMDSSGKLCMEQNKEAGNSGINYSVINISNLLKGSYVLHISSGNTSYVKSFIKH